ARRRESPRRCRSRRGAIVGGTLSRLAADGRPEQLAEGGPEPPGGSRGRDRPARRGDPAPARPADRPRRRTRRRAGAAAGDRRPLGADVAAGGADPDPRRRLAGRRPAAPAAKPPGLDAVESPRFSIVTPVYETPVEILWSMIESVLAQTFGDWEL